MATTDRVTVVIPNYNGMKYLAGCLDSLFDGSLVPDVIVVDNGSGDGSVPFLRERYPQVLVHELPVNTGFCHAVNAGLKLTRTEYAILLNNDVTVDRFFCERLLEAADRDGRIFSVQAKMLSMADPGIIDDAGDFLSALGWAYARGQGKRAGLFSRDGAVFSACAGAAIYRMKVFGEIGFFDERHFCYLEDVDIGYRAALAGYRNRYCAGAKVCHAGSATTGSKHNAFKVEQASCNTRYLFLKNMPRWQYVLHIPAFRLGEAFKRAYFRRLGLAEAYDRGLERGEFLAMMAAEKGALTDMDMTYRKGSLLEETCLPEEAYGDLSEVMPLYVGETYPFTWNAVPAVFLTQLRLFVNLFRGLLQV